jgi:uncharacterized membrane protein
MKIQYIKLLWNRVRSSFWFVSAIMAIGAIILCIFTLSIDRLFLKSLTIRGWWLYTGGPDGARTVLSTIAGSMITVAGVVFSITIVVLSLASSQFGPRLIRNFMDQTINQMVLGTFIGTFVFCIIALQNIHDSGEGYFVPYVSVTTGILLGLASLGVLIYFIHSISTSIRANNIIARVCKELKDSIERLYPEEYENDQSMNERTIEDLIEERGYLSEKYYREIDSVASEKSGYLVAYDIDELLEIAVKEDVIIRIDHRPGDFITRNNPLLWIWPDKKLDKKLGKKLNSAFVMGSERTSDQDVEYPVHLLVEIAVRALSPGINDPFTAITCIDWLGEALSKLAGKKIQGPFYFDQNGKIRVIAKPVTFSGVVDAAFTQIRQNAATVPAVSIRLLESIYAIAYQVRRDEHRKVLQNHADMILQSCKENVTGEKDRKDIQERHNRVIKTLNRPVSSREESIIGKLLEQKYSKIL